MIGRMAIALCTLVLAGTPARTAELVYPNGPQGGSAFRLSSAEFETMWHEDSPREPWLFTDSVASTYDVGTRALRAGDEERAYRFWLSLARAGHCRAKFAVGYLLDPASPKALESVTIGDRAADDRERAAAALAWYLSAAEEGWPAAQRRVADAYADGMAVPSDFAAAELWYRRAARNGDPDAMLALAAGFLYADATSEQRIEGLFWAHVARDKPLYWWHDDRSADAVIAAYEDILPPHDIVAAMEQANHWQPLDEVLGISSTAYPRYRDMTETERASVLATQPGLVALASSPAAEFDAGGVAYFGGDRRRALELWWPLARHGHCQAQYALGKLLEGAVFADGWAPLVVPEPFGQDQALDLRLIWMAATQGHPYAQDTLSFWLNTGPIGRSDGSPERWSRRAVEQGLYWASTRIPGNPNDRVGTLSLYLRDQAAYRGSLPEARFFSLRGTEEEIAAALRQAVTWRPEVP